MVKLKSSGNLKSSLYLFVSQQKKFTNTQKALLETRTETLQKLKERWKSHFSPFKNFSFRSAQLPWVSIAWRICRTWEEFQKIKKTSMAFQFATHITGNLVKCSSQPIKLYASNWKHIIVYLFTIYLFSHKANRQLCELLGKIKYWQKKKLCVFCIIVPYFGAFQ